MPRLQLVPLSPPNEPEKRRVRLAASKPAAIIECRRCASRAITQVLLGASLRSGRVTGGTKQWMCAMCLARGELVEVA